MSERRTLRPWEKAFVREHQQGLCACGCERKLAEHRHEWDHVKEVWEFPEGTPLDVINDLANFQALVVRPCHQAKSAKGTKRRSKADRQRRVQEQGKGRAPKKGTLWRWRTFAGEVKEKRT